MQGLASRAIAPPAAFHRLGGGAAIGAEAVAGVPVHERAAFRERTEMIVLEKTAHRDRAQVDEHDIAARLQRRDGGRRERKRESRLPLEEAEERDLQRLAKTAGF